MTASPAPGAPAPRLVLDTNVVLSALLFGRGPTARLRALWQGGQLVPLMSAATARELVRVLAYPKFRLSAAEQRELLADILPWAEVVVVPDPPPAVPDCRDPKDLPFLHLAAAGQAHALVTGDADLLALAGDAAPGAAAAPLAFGLPSALPFALPFAIWTVPQALAALTAPGPATPPRGGA